MIIGYDDIAIITKISKKRVFSLAKRIFVCYNSIRYSLFLLRGGASHMPNIKSAKKRVKIIEKKTLTNNMIKTGYKSAVKKFEEAIAAGNLEEAKVLFSEATKKIDQACTKGVIVKNTAARKKSSLSKKLNAAMA